MGIQQFEDASLSGVVADAGDSLDLGRITDSLGSIPLRRRAPLDQRLPQRRHLATQDQSKRFRPSLGLNPTRGGHRLFRAPSVEERQSGVYAEYRGHGPPRER